jgi:ribosome-binding protein aMBF1 (putative translation factor)
MQLTANIIRIKAVTRPSLDRIIERLQSCVADANELQLKMLERILAIALLQAHEDKDEAEDDYDE